MKQFSLINGENKITFNFPTKLSEIKEEYLTEITKNVKVADDYTLVGIVYHESLGSIIIARKRASKSVTAGIVPIFIKAGNTENSFIKSCNIKDKIIISGSQLSLGHHVACPANVLSLDYFIKYLDKDNEVAKRYNNTYGKEECFFIEFKLVPNCDIVGFYDSKSEINVSDYNYVEVKNTND